jgi:5'-3' exonuclease
VAERAVAALGIVVWPMVEYEADDALATAACRFKDQPGVEQIVICSPDKDLAQAVCGVSVVCWDRRRDIVLDDEGVLKKFGVQPRSIPDWLALVGDAADGIPGIPGWGAKSASGALSRFDHLEAIPKDPRRLDLPLGRATRLVESLAAHRAEALLYRRLATLRVDVPLEEGLADLEWRGAKPELREVCRDLGAEDVLRRVAEHGDSLA